MPVRSLRFQCLPIVAGAIALALPAAGYAQDTTAAAQTSTPSPDVIEPEALAALDKMGKALRALPHFTIDGDVTNETVLDTGQKLQFAGKLHIVAKPPHGLLISVKSDEKNRDFYYDGKSLTLSAPRLKYYAAYPAPGTIQDMVAAVSFRLGIEIPLADLFAWGADPTLVQRVKSAYVVRPETIGGKQCMHYAFRQDMVDWQLWLPTTGAALPCKLVITDTTDSSMPQYSSVLTWNTTTVPPASTFAFKPSSDFKKIEFAQLSDDDAAATTGDTQ